MRVLHVVATPRPTSESSTLEVTRAFFDSLRTHVPDLEVETLDLYEDELPAVAGLNIETKYALMRGLRVGPRHQPSWGEIERLIAQFMAVDLVVVSSPMWNFHIPYALKFYVDAIIQPGYLFAYDAQGVPHGLCEGRRMVFVTTRGSDYSEGGPMHAFDLQEPYLRSIFGFCGVTEMHFVNAQPMDMGSERRDAALSVAVAAAQELAAALAHAPAVSREAESSGLNV